jgi:hypothetical protein
MHEVRALIAVEIGALLPVGAHDADPGGVPGGDLLELLLDRALVEVVALGIPERIGGVVRSGLRAPLQAPPDVALHRAPAHDDELGQDEHREHHQHDVRAERRPQLARRPFRLLGGHSLFQR